MRDARGAINGGQSRLQTFHSESEDRAACGRSVALLARDGGDETSVLRTEDRRCGIGAEEIRKGDVARFKKTRVVSASDLRAGVALRRHVVQIDSDKRGVAHSHIRRADCRRNVRAR